MPNFMKMMKQAASMQKDMERVQGELAEKTLDFSAGGGMVTATARSPASRLIPRSSTPPRWTCSKTSSPLPWMAR